jgi:hypothetical protein
LTASSPPAPPIDRAAVCLSLADDDLAALADRLHDGLSQTLTGLAFLARSLERELAGSTGGAIAAELCGIAERAAEEAAALAVAIKPEDLGRALELAAAESGASLRLSGASAVGAACRTRIHKLVDAGARAAARHGPVDIALERASGACVVRIVGDAPWPADGLAARIAALGGVWRSRPETSGRCEIEIPDTLTTESHS